MEPQVVVLLQGKLADVGVNFKEVLEVRTKNIQASRSRTENFVSSVSQHAQPSLDHQQSASPLYNTPTKSRTPQPGYQNTNPDILNLDPSSSSSALSRMGPQSDQQLLIMEEAQPQNSYINMRGEAIDTIERTINELGSVFGQLAAMVSEQGEQIQRIDANTEDVVDNVEGAQRELMKYWSRVSGNRWLVAKMFGVLMVCNHREVYFRSRQTNIIPDFLPLMGSHRGIIQVFMGGFMHSLGVLGIKRDRGVDHRLPKLVQRCNAINENVPCSICHLRIALIVEKVLLTSILIKSTLLPSCLSYDIPQ